MLSFQGSEIATVKITPECYFIVVKCYSENNIRRLWRDKLVSDVAWNILSW